MNTARLRVGRPCTRDQRHAASLDTVRHEQRSLEKRGQIYRTGSLTAGTHEAHRFPCCSARYRHPPGRLQRTRDGDRLDFAPSLRSVDRRVLFVRDSNLRIFAHFDALIWAPRGDRWIVFAESPTRNSCFLTCEPCEPAGEQEGEGDEEPCEGGFDGRLEVFGEASGAVDPAERPFDQRLYNVANSRFHRWAYGGAVHPEAGPGKRPRCARRRFRRGAREYE